MSHIKPDLLKGLNNEIMVLIWIQGEVTCQKLFQILWSPDIVLHNHLHHWFPEVPLRIERRLHHCQARREAAPLPVRPASSPAGLDQFSASYSRRIGSELHSIWIRDRFSGPGTSSSLLLGFDGILFDSLYGVLIESGRGRGDLWLCQDWRKLLKLRNLIERIYLLVLNCLGIGFLIDVNDDISSWRSDSAIARTWPGG